MLTSITLLAVEEMLAEDIRRHDAEQLKPTLREYVNIYITLRSALNLAAKLGRRLAAPYTESNITVCAMIIPVMLKFKL